jgi:DNA-binding PadR family transcriptional regulator
VVTVRTGLRTLTTTEAAVLALLAIEGESSGYDLLKKVSNAIGFVWAPARSQLYAVLPRLVRLGLAERRDVVQARRPDKQLYRISEDGREALRAWHESVEPGTEDGVLLKLFVGGLTTDETLVEHLVAYRRDVEAKLARLREIEPTNTGRGHDRYHRFLLRLGIDELELRLRWVDETLADLAGADPA